MKALLIAAFALTLAVPAMAQTAAPAETKDGAAVAVTPKTTYEQAFTECAEATKDAAGEKAAAVKTCMLEKGFELKDEAAAPAASDGDKHSALDGAVFAQAAVTSTTAVTTTTDGGVAVTTPTTSVTTGTDGTTVTTTEGTVVAPTVDATATTTMETKVDGAATTTTTTHESH